MTYTTLEASRWSGQPVDFYKFVLQSPTAELLVHTIDFGDYADTAALLADWTEVDPGNIGTWTLVTPAEPLDSVRVPQVLVNGSYLEGQRSAIEKPLGGFTPGATVIVRTHQYENEDNPHGPGFQWNSAFDYETTADGSGIVSVSLGWTMFTDGTIDNKYIQFDRVRIYERSASAVGFTYAYTSDGLSHTFRGDTYAPAIFTRSEISSGGGESSDGEFELSMPRDHVIALLVRDGLPTSPIALTHYRVHRPDIAAGTSYATPFVGQAVRSRFRGAECVITFATPRSLLDRKKPSVLCQQHCNWMLYDARFQLDRDNFSFTSTITAIDTNTVTIDGLSDASGDDSTKFQFGSILVPSGEYAFVENQGGDVVTLLNVPQTINVGDVVTVYQGCDRTVATCLNRFDNLVHFGGRPTMKAKNVFGPTGLAL